jgi:hypothetical protein
VNRVDDQQQQQPKSLDSVEHDSLDTIGTATSADSSKRGENVLKALERRYHLLYLRAIEIQCMFEGLLDRRNYLESVEDFHPVQVCLFLKLKQKQKWKQAQKFNFESSKQHFIKLFLSQVDTSDEEPVAKVAKFSNDTHFTSCKQRGDDEKVHTEFDADSEGSEGEMMGGDCVDGSKIIAVKHSTPPKTPSPNSSFETQPATVIKRPRPKDFSKFHRSNRKSKNCAIFYYKHVDTDTDQLNDEGDAEKPLVSSENSEEEIWEFTDTSNDVSPLTPDKDGNIGDELECFPLELSPEQREPATINSQQQRNGNVGIASNTMKVSFDTWRELW